MQVSTKATSYPCVIRMRTVTGVLRDVARTGTPVIGINTGNAISLPLHLVVPVLKVDCSTIDCKATSGLSLPGFLNLVPQSILLKCAAAAAAAVVGASALPDPTATPPVVTTVTPPAPPTAATPAAASDTEQTSVSYTTINDIFKRVGVPRRVGQRVTSALLVRYVSPRKGLVDVGLHFWAMSPKEVYLPGYSRYGKYKGAYRYTAAWHCKLMCRAVVAG